MRTAGSLHQGELEAMRLASEIDADLLLLDDLLARRKATRIGLKVIGTVGILLLANRQGRISSSRTMVVVDSLVNEHNLYLY